VTSQASGEADVFDALYRDYLALNRYLVHQGEPSLSSVVETNLTKSLLLAAASYLEHRVQGIIKSLYTSNETGEEPENHPRVHFIQKKAISRQYHTYFNWEETRTSSFFAMFGPDVKKHASERIKADPRLDEGARAFLSLGESRNRLVHQNFAAFTVDSTPSEISDRFQAARYFLEKIPSILNLEP
jgi:hypothetical protein